MDARPRPRRPVVSAVVLACAALGAAFAACSTNKHHGFGSDAGDDTAVDGVAPGPDTSSGSGMTDSSSSSGQDTGGSGTSDSSGGGKDTGGGPPGLVTCSAPSTTFQNNYSGACGTWRWSVKTGTDYDVGKINLLPQPTTILALTGLSTVTGSYCNRTTNELNTYYLKDVSLKFEALESDGDYHIVAEDVSTGATMVTEVPFPGCVGQSACSSSQPLYCEITHARAAVDAKNPTQAYGDMGYGSIIGVGFFDTDELMNHPGPAGEAPNGIELHPILAICFGLGCNPLAGY